MSIALPLALRRPDRVQILALCCALALGIAAFVGVTGGDIARPSNLGWLSEGDPAQHYLGWSFFRHAPWQIPLGANPDYGLELGGSIVYTDSIPLFAFLLKPFSRLLPAEFQYFGVWVLACFCLQAVFARRLLARWTSSLPLQLVGVAFFVLTPAFLWRLRGHEALLGHWLLLAGLDLYLAPSFRRRAWLLLIALAVLVHAYLWSMVTAIWIADLVQRALTGELKRSRAAADGALGFAFAVLIMAVTGYFIGGGAALAASGYGYYRMNLASPFDSDEGWSRLIPDLPQAGGDYEGFAFLGIGMWIVVLVALGLVLRGAAPRWRRERALPLAVLCGTLLAFAASHHVGLGRLHVLSFALPFRVLALLSVFRSSGRFFWPVLYLIYLGAFRVVLRTVAVRPAVVAVGIALVALQIADSTPALAALRSRLERPEATSPLQAPFWQRAARHYRRIVVVPPRGDDAGSQPLARFAADAGLAIDSGYFARVDPARLSALRARTLGRLARRELDADALYVFADGFTQLAPIAGGRGDQVGDVDGIRVLAPGIDGRKAFDAGAEFRAAEPSRCPGAGTRGLVLSRGARTSACLAYGWGRPGKEGVWARAPQSGVLLRVAGKRPPHSAALVVEADFKPVPGRGAEAGCSVQVFANGQRLGELRFAGDGGRRRFTLPMASLLTGDERALLIEFEVPARPLERLPWRFRKRGVGLRLFGLTLAASSPQAPTAG
jgi:hypothetical protein